jgi:hypothetical protein
MTSTRISANKSQQGLTTVRGSTPTPIATNSKGTAIHEHTNPSDKSNPLATVQASNQGGSVPTGPTANPPAAVDNSNPPSGPVFCDDGRPNRLSAPGPDKGQAYYRIGTHQLILNTDQTKEQTHPPTSGHAQDLHLIVSAHKASASALGCSLENMGDGSCLYCTNNNPKQPAWERRQRQGPSSGKRTGSLPRENGPRHYYPPECVPPGPTTNPQGPQPNCAPCQTKRDDVYRAVTAFYHNRLDLWHLNQAYITLIPKKNRHFNDQ